MKNEVWKEYPLNFAFEGYYKIEVSNFGHIKTFTSQTPEGKIVNGSLQGGYRILRSKLKKKWSTADTEKIEVFNSKIADLNTKIKELGSKKSILEQKEKLREERDKLIQKRKKLNTKLTNKYTINLALLFHKAVAELYLDAPKSNAHKFIIHTDFDKENNAVTNLSWATQEDLDERLKKHPKMILREFTKQFEDQIPQVKASKLTEMEVLHIKKRLKKGDSLKRLAKQFRVSDMQIHRIKTGENWGHVKLIEDLKEDV